MSRKRQKRSAENPSFPMTWDDALDAGRSSSGVRITRRRAMGYAAVWRAVSLIAGDIGKLPLKVYKKLDSGRNIIEDVSHPAYWLLYNKPNPVHTPFIFKQTLAHHVLTEGNAYAYIDRKAGVPVQLLMLQPNAVEPVRVDGEPWYRYTPPNGAKACRLPGVDVIHIKGLGFDGIKGYPVLQYHSDTLGAAVAARDHSAKYFKNGTRPGGALVHRGDKKLTDAARHAMRESWERLHKGLDNAHKVAILEEGTEYVPFVCNARDAQLLENREFDSREIANIFGVPTHKLGDPSKVSYNSLDAENQSYFDDTLSRWLMLFSEEFSDKLLTDSERRSGSHAVSFDYKSLLVYLSAQVKFIKDGLATGLICPDEGRALLNMDSRPDGQGGVYVGAKASEPKAEPVEPAPQLADGKDDEEKPDDSSNSDSGKTTEGVRAIGSGVRAVISDTISRMVRRLATHAEREAKKTNPDWDSVGQGNIDAVESAISTLASLLSEYGRSVDAGQFATLFTDDVACSLRDHRDAEHIARLSKVWCEIIENEGKHARNSTA